MGTRHWWSGGRAYALAAVAVAAVLLAGCGSSHGDASGSGSHPGSSSAPGGTAGASPSHGLHVSGGSASKGSGSSAKPGSGHSSEGSGDGTISGPGKDTGSTAASGGTAVPASKRCRTSQLKATVRPLGAAAGTHHASVILTNTSGSSCQSSGYLGLQLVSASGGKIVTSIARDTARRPTTVTLKAHATMYAPTSWGAVAVNGESQSGSCEPNPHGVQVALPGASGSVHATWSYGPVCGHGVITVGALLSGSGPAAG
jgi:hypothetical protein